MKIIDHNSCRVCSSTELIPVFDLGDQFVSDFVDHKDIQNQNGVKCPINLLMCKSCWLLQQQYTPANLLERGSYWYRSGVTETMRLALYNVVDDIESRINLENDDIVLDIGSNDATLLRSYSNEKLVRVGVEPAENMVSYYSNSNRIKLINEFWSAGAFNSAIGGTKAKVITACGMLYDLEDPNTFIADVAKVLAPEGLFVAQLMCLRQMLEMSDVGNLAHEHFEFYSLRSLGYLLDQHGLEIIDLSQNSVNGKSYRLFMAHKGVRTVSKAVRAAIALEDKMDLHNPRSLAATFNEWKSNRERCCQFINVEAMRGKTIWAYGASTKGNVILQWYGLDSTIIDGAADRSPEKWGKYTVGTGIHITSEQEARQANPDYFFVLPYAFINEFIPRERDFLHQGGAFIVPLPTPYTLRYHKKRLTREDL